MGQNLSKYCCCEAKENKLITIPKQTQVDRNIYTLRELSEEDFPETEYDIENLNQTVQNLHEIKINKSIIICRRDGKPSEEYVILDELGEGSFGVVVKVAHKITKNIRAMKIIKKLNLEKNFSKSKLYDEITILKEIDHPNIIKIFEFFENEENYYMVTEYCAEGDLATHIEKMECLDETIVKILMFQILSAVSYLHSRKIMHGDLKLENILIETLSSVKTRRSFRSSITYDLDQIKANSLNIISNRQAKNINNIINENNNIKNSSSHFLCDSKNNNKGKDEENRNNNNNLERVNKEELFKMKHIDHGPNKVERIILNELSKTNTIENDFSLGNENSKFNQLQNFDFYSINDDKENANAIANQKVYEISNTIKLNEKEVSSINNYVDSGTIKNEILNNINPYIIEDKSKITNESIFILNKKSSNELLLQRKLMFFKYSNDHKVAAKTTKQDVFYSSTNKNNINNHHHMKKNNNRSINHCITEEVERWENNSKINSERNSNSFLGANFNSNNFFSNNINNNNNNNKYNSEKRGYVPVTSENNKNYNNSSRRIFTEEEVSYEDNNAYSENFFSRKINKEIENGAQVPHLFSYNNADNLASKSKLNLNKGGHINAGKVNIPNLDLNSINKKNENFNNNLLDDNSNSNNIKFKKINNNLLNNKNNNNQFNKVDTIEELEKQLRSNINNNNITNNKTKYSLKDAYFNLNPMSKRTFNNSISKDYSNNNSGSNQFETINSDSNTMSISIEQNFSTINQNHKDMNSFLFQKENENQATLDNNNDNNNKNINNNYKNFRKSNSNNKSLTHINLTLDGCAGINQLENFSNFEIKLIDFGCSKIFKKGNRKFQDIIGTLFYIAPEVIKNNYNEKCDLWSCGVIMYFLLVGFPPFFALTDTEVFEQILSADFSFAFAEFENVSESAKDLIKKLLEVNPKKRLSAKEALEHEFFQEISSNRLNEYNLDFSVLQNLKKNKIEQKFQQAVVSFLVYNFAKKDEIINLRKLFKTIDFDQDGRISKEELMVAMKKFDNLEITEKEIEEILYVIDSDKSGFLEYEEFIAATINKKGLFTDENLKAAFYLFDQDKNGTISTEEIRNILIGKATNIPEKVVNDLYKQINNLSFKEGAADAAASSGKRVNHEIDFEQFKKIIYQVVIEE